MNAAEPDPEVNTNEAIDQLIEEIIAAELKSLDGFEYIEENTTDFDELRTDKSFKEWDQLQATQWEPGRGPFTGRALPILEAMVTTMARDKVIFRRHVHKLTHPYDPRIRPRVSVADVIRDLDWTPDQIMPIPDYIYERVADGEVTVTQDGATEVLIVGKDCELFRKADPKTWGSVQCEYCLAPVVEPVGCVPESIDTDDAGREFYAARQSELKTAARLGSNGKPEVLRRCRMCLMCAIRMANYNKLKCKGVCQQSGPDRKRRVYPNEFIAADEPVFHDMTRFWRVDESGKVFGTAAGLTLSQIAAREDIRAALEGLIGRALRHFATRTAVVIKDWRKHFGHIRDLLKHAETEAKESRKRLATKERQVEVLGAELRRLTRKYQSEVAELKERVSTSEARAVIAENRLQTYVRDRQISGPPRPDPPEGTPDPELADYVLQLEQHIDRLEDAWDQLRRRDTLAVEVPVLNTRTRVENVRPVGPATFTVSHNGRSTEKVVRKGATLFGLAEETMTELEGPEASQDYTLAAFTVTFLEQLSSQATCVTSIQPGRHQQVVMWPKEHVIPAGGQMRVILPMNFDCVGAFNPVPPLPPRPERTDRRSVSEGGVGMNPFRPRSTSGTPRVRRLPVRAGTETREGESTQTRPQDNP